MTNSSSALEKIQQYYGEVLKTQKDLQTNACCTEESIPDYLKPILGEIHDDVMAKFYGCGSPIPQSLEGLTVLDLGSGSGRDVYLLSKLVGPKGKVIGVDMTPEQLEVARKHINYHTQKFGFSKPNVEFLEGYIEDLESLGIQNNSIDLVISNCVLNLSPDKSRVFSEIFRVLKPGGELYFSDVFSGRRIPQELAFDPVIRGECLGGAMYLEDFRRLLSRLGCLDYRLVSRRVLRPNNVQLESRLGLIDFYSLTVRAFKLDLEDRCEDYGQMAIYQGSIPENSHAFLLDDHHLFETQKPTPVCGNTAAMLSQTRYASHFEIQGDALVHYGLFDCGPEKLDLDKNGDPGRCC